MRYRPTQSLCPAEPQQYHLRHKCTLRGRAVSQYAPYQA
ncbi:Uncharacterised protein [Vibrio cholerae]|nr:Uncharacterised protein [Vibrio cholerae]CSI90033.1 Uncharacterised protein [Vibrio cholerae]